MRVISSFCHQKQCIFSFFVITDDFFQSLITFSKSSVRHFVGPDLGQEYIAILSNQQQQKKIKILSASNNETANQLLRACTVHH